MPQDWQLGQFKLFFIANVPTSFEKWFTVYSGLAGLRK